MSIKGIKNSSGISIFVDDNDKLQRFVCTISEKESVFKAGQNVIAANAFAYDETLKVVECKENLATIEEDAFKESGLNVFCCADIDKANEAGVELSSTDTSSTDTSSTGTLTIQHNAFLNCHELHTVILPQVSGTLRIEKDAFAGCSKLRTVVIPVKEKGSISISPDAFSGCRNVMFASNNKDVVSFARGQGFGYVGL
ncbi:MAG: leucine-rich repeat protein [Treponema sp.]|nr:leucine-rich repeat protein [Treponema sp.]